jgi:hypothetical protein
MSRLVEKVARTICCPEGCIYAIDNDHHLCIADVEKAGARAAIAAVLEDMRAPSDAVIAAGLDAPHADDADLDTVATGIYRAMLAAYARENGMKL